MSVDNARYASKRSDVKYDPRRCNASTSEIAKTSSGEGMPATPYASSTGVLDDVAMGTVPQDRSIYLLHQSEEMSCNCVMTVTMLENICVLIEASGTLSPAVTIC